MRSATLRAATVIGTTAGVPLLDAAVRASTREPTVEDVVVEGLPATVYHPPTTGPWPATIVLNGATPLGNRHRAVQRLASGLSRAGFLAVLPELPGLEDGEVDIGTAEATVCVAAAVAGRGDVLGGRVALLGVSTGAGLALLAASDERLQSHVSVVAAVAPFADLRLVLRLATTGVYEQDGELRAYRTVPLLRRVVARSLAASLADAHEREVLLDWLPRSSDERDALAPLPAAVLGELQDDGRAVAAVLANRDPARFDALYDALPAAAHELVAALSPGRCELSIDAPVELVTAPDDGYFPLGEAQQLALALPSSRLTVTSALEHVRLRWTPRGAADLLRLGGATIRSLRAASADVPQERQRVRRTGEPLRFVLVGAGGYVVNLVVFAALLGVDAAYGAASITAYLVSNALMYLGNRVFTFRLGRDGLWSGYVRYFLVGLLVVALNVALLAAMVEAGGLDPRLAQALALLAVTPVAFTANRRWTFRLAGA